VSIVVRPATTARFGDVATGVLAHSYAQVAGWAAVVPRSGPCCHTYHTYHTYLPGLTR
jgi:hypothetical protein